MVKIHYDNAARPELVRARKVAIIGYGSQGHAHALNLRDSGVTVQVGLPEGSRSRAKAEAEGLKVTSVAEAAPVRRGGMGRRGPHPRGLRGGGSRDDGIMLRLRVEEVNAGEQEGREQ